MTVMIIKLEELSSELLSEIGSHHDFNKVLFPCGSLTGLYKGDYIREYEFIFHLTSTTENNILWPALGEGIGLANTPTYCPWSTLGSII